MKRLAIAAVLACAPRVAATQQPVPEIRFDANADLLKLPSGLHLGEVAGVAVNSRRHIFIFTRSGERSAVHGATAAQLFEFNTDGTFLREMGKDLRLCVRPHGARRQGRQRLGD